MSAHDSAPNGQAEAMIDAFTDAVYDLLHARAQSIGIMDIGIEVHDWFIDGELIFTSGPDLGFSLDTRTGECRYCELLPGSEEQWLDEVRGELLVLDSPSDEARAAAALDLLNGMLDARRPLLKR